MHATKTATGFLAVLAAVQFVIESPPPAGAETLVTEPDVVEVFFSAPVSLDRVTELAGLGNADVGWTTFWHETSGGTYSSGVQLSGFSDAAQMAPFVVSELLSLYESAHADAVVQESVPVPTDAGLTPEDIQSVELSRQVLSASTQEVATDLGSDAPTLSVPVAQYNVSTASVLSVFETALDVAQIVLIDTDTGTTDVIAVSAALTDVTVSNPDEADCGAYGEFKGDGDWYPNYGDMWTQSDGTRRYVQHYFTFSAWRMHNLKVHACQAEFRPNQSYEHDSVYDNFDDRQYLGEPVSWGSNMPSSYIDTDWRDDEVRRVYTMGSSRASRMSAGTQYWTIIRTKLGDAATDRGYIVSQRGTRKPGWCDSTWCVFPAESRCPVESWDHNVPGHTAWNVGAAPDNAVDCQGAT